MIGRGSYRVSKSSLNLSGDPPQFTKSKNGVRIAHREFLFDVVSSTTASAFNTYNQLSINPGVSNTFPWLSNIAASFQQYKIHGCVFEFITSSGNYSTTGAALGEVMMATQYNANNTQFSTKSQMLNTEYSSVTVPSSNCMHMIECDPKQTSIELLYIRTGTSQSPVPNQDYRLYDLGDFTIATQGVPTAKQTVGSLYITYDVELFKPISDIATIAPSGVDPSANYSFTAPQSNANLDCFGVTNTGNFPTPTAIFDNIGLTINRGVGTVHTGSISFPPSIPAGTYLVIITWWGSTTQTTAPSLSNLNVIYRNQADNTSIANGLIITNSATPVPSDQFYYNQSPLPVNKGDDFNFYTGFSIPANSLGFTIGIAGPTTSTVFPANGSGTTNQAFSQITVCRVSPNILT